MFKKKKKEVPKFFQNEEVMETLEVFASMPSQIQDENWLANRITCFHCKYHFTLVDGMNPVLNADPKVIIACPNCRGSILTTVSTNRGDTIYSVVLK